LLDIFESVQLLHELLGLRPGWEIVVLTPGADGDVLLILSGGTVLVRQTSGTVSEDLQFEVEVGVGYLAYYDIFAP